MRNEFGVRNSELVWTAVRARREACPHASAVHRKSRSGRVGEGLAPPVQAIRKSRSDGVGRHALMPPQTTANPCQDA